MEGRKCPECGNTIFGRADKKFCNDACRNAFNNKKHPQQTNLMRNINNRLAKNRRILETLNPDGKKKTHREKLLKEGFDFDYYTNTVTTKAGDVYRFCYEQGYLLLDEGYILLVKRNND